eukprot:TRINITY_DN1364_c0_g1_i1.p3 TRINITY_DN1364_c0_g1~~TRINITY_DN1364_c0_g1_i1.p3  ORF type:complete len:304 (+),score=32.84 TRINITY_DN1364_c0_g1_i1:157-1068(+)
MTTSEGFFGRVSYLGIGDEYDKKKKLDRKEKEGESRPFVVSGSKAGPQALFEKTTKSLAQGDPYIDPGLVERKSRALVKKEDLKPFVISAKTTKSVMPGLLGDYPKHEPEYDITRRGEVPKKKGEGDDGKKPSHTFTTRPTAKGGYGFAGTTIGGASYKYISDPFDDRAARNAQFRSSRGEKLSGAPPFKSAVGAPMIGRHSHTGADLIYSLTGPLPARKADSKMAAPDKAPVPWKPSAPAKSGKLPLSGRYPEHVSDPVDAKPPGKLREKGEDKTGSHWVPAAGTKSRTTRSVAFNPMLAYR